MVSLWYHKLVNNKNKKTLNLIYKNPINGNIEWRKIEFLLISIGVVVIEGKGSLVTFIKDKVRLEIHRPHPNKEALIYRIKYVREFLKDLGIK